MSFFVCGFCFVVVLGEFFGWLVFVGIFYVGWGFK